MAQTITFRSAVNGFHRGDVVKYIGELMEENAALKQQVETLRVLGKTLTAETGAQKAEIERLQAALEKAQTKGQEGGRQLDAARLGEALYDARRFSDLLIGEAREKTGAMFDRAARTADGSSERIGALTAQTAALQAQIEEALSGIEANLAALDGEMRAFSGGINDDRDAFLQAFTDETTKKFEAEEA